jgi:hypothetical protein
VSEEDERVGRDDERDATLAQLPVEIAEPGPWLRCVGDREPARQHRFLQSAG